MTKSHLNINNNASPDLEGDIRYDSGTESVKYRDSTVEQSLEKTTPESTGVFTSTYAGSGAGQPIVGVPFQPRLVHVMVGSGGAGSGSFFIRNDTHAGTDSFDVGAGSIVSDGIVSIDPNGFTVGTNVNIDSVGTTYTFVCFK